MTEAALAVARPSTPSTAIYKQHFPEIYARHKEILNHFVEYYHACQDLCILSFVLAAVFREHYKHQLLDKATIDKLMREHMMSLHLDNFANK